MSEGFVTGPETDFRPIGDVYDDYIDSILSSDPEVVDAAQNLVEGLGIPRTSPNIDFFHDWHTYSVQESLRRARENITPGNTRNLVLSREGAIMRSLVSIIEVSDIATIMDKDQDLIGRAVRGLARAKFPDLIGEGGFASLNLQHEAGKCFYECVKDSRKRASDEGNAYRLRIVGKEIKRRYIRAAKRLHKIGAVSVP